MADADKFVGTRVAQLRGDMSQKDLAEKMRGYGWKWVQQTVGIVEKGERPLRLTEASDLVQILGVPLGDLFSAGNLLSRELNKARASERDLSSQIRDLQEIQEAVSEARQTLQLLVELSQGGNGPYHVNGSAAWLLEHHLSDGTGNIYLDPRDAVMEAGVPSEAVEQADEEVQRVFRVWQESGTDGMEFSGAFSADNRPSEDNLKYLHGGPVPEATNQLLDRLRSERYGRALQMAYPQVSYEQGESSFHPLEIVGLHSGAGGLGNLIAGAYAAIAADAAVM